MAADGSDIFGGGRDGAGSRWSRFEWSPNGDTLAVTQSSSSTLLLWRAPQRKTTQLELGMKNIACFAWSPNAQFVAAGTSKGNLVVLDVQSGKKVPVLGKHNRAITDIVWADNARILCISDDKSFSVSGVDGDTLFQSTLPDVPSKLKVLSMSAADDNSKKTLCHSSAAVLLGGKSLYLHSLTSYESTPSLLKFHFKYGPVVAYEQISPVQLVLLHASGSCSVISLDPNDLGKELAVSRMFKSVGGGLGVCSASGKVAVTGDAQVKVCLMTDMKETVSTVELEEDAESLEGACWTEDGKFLAVTSKLYDEPVLCIHEAQNTPNRTPSKRMTFDIEILQVFVGKIHSFGAFLKTQRDFSKKTCNNVLQYLDARDWSVLDEYRHKHCITAIFPEQDGSRLLFYDTVLGHYCYNPASRTVIHIAEASGAMGHTQALVKLCKRGLDRQIVAQVANHRLERLDVATAMLLHRCIGSASNVMLLERFKGVEDKHTLMGYVAMYMKDFDQAQKHFLASAAPIAALEMRRDLRQWEQALTLAQSISPQDVPTLCKEYAQQLENDGQYSEAQKMWEKAFQGTGALRLSPDEAEAQASLCWNGFIRTTMCLGDLLGQVKWDARQLCLECGVALVQLRQYQDAGAVFEKGQHWELAAENYLKGRNYSKLSAIIQHVRTSRVLVDYGLMKEGQQLYEEAAEAFKQARAFDELIRVYVSHLSRIEEAVQVARECKSREGAKLVADFFAGIGDYKSVVEFYLLADMKAQAFAMAQKYELMDTYAELLGEDISADELHVMAMHFERLRDHYSAGKYYLRSGKYHDAIKHFLQCVGDPRALELAIETVGLAKDDALTHELISYLMTEGEGVPKDPKYIFKLYMSLGQFKEAARTALIIAREEWACGNYRPAHDLLLDTHKRLLKSDNHVPMQLENMLMLLHSYILVKAVVKSGDHYRGARLLIRISNNISKFPTHAIQILTSTVIECQRAGLKRSAFEFAAILMRPENRGRVDAKHKRKIEAIIRHPEDEEGVDQATACPFCNYAVPEYELDCLECKNTLPYCIASVSLFEPDQAVQS
ncbi:WD repeat-containing protein 19 [Sorochytrium milnesiophthora]